MSNDNNSTNLQSKTALNICTCNGKGDGEIVACASTSCTIKSYHVECVGLKSAPQEQWYCDSCASKWHGWLQQTEEESDKYKASVKAQWDPQVLGSRTRGQKLKNTTDKRYDTQVMANAKPIIPDESTMKRQKAKAARAEKAEAVRAKKAQATGPKLTIATNPPVNNHTPRSRGTNGIEIELSHIMKGILSPIDARQLAKNANPNENNGQDSPLASYSQGNSPAPMAGRAQEDTHKEPDPRDDASDNSDYHEAPQTRDQTVAQTNGDHSDGPAEEPSTSAATRENSLAASQPGSAPSPTPATSREGSVQASSSAPLPANPTSPSNATSPSPTDEQTDPNPDDDAEWEGFSAQELDITKHPLFPQLCARTRKRDRLVIFDSSSSDDDASTAAGSSRTADEALEIQEDIEGMLAWPPANTHFWYRNAGNGVKNKNDKGSKRACYMFGLTALKREQREWEAREAAKPIERRVCQPSRMVVKPKKRKRRGRRDVY
ncbi:uncharacterized protein KY384_000810 [Bacidia gigantensis]|uniref:uncharacterized protein n=1 Tax=Bacidia gigantensis TaxID=2732470 RepID=UPI001D048150|nr:uncharacterized protein KY384_000810 [Bacidia gigantensis]KAG8526048.1 hypothetical protein KY384_000810 [Bacidia gigantensis]